MWNTLFHCHVHAFFLEETSCASPWRLWNTPFFTWNQRSQVFSPKYNLATVFCDWWWVPVPSLPGECSLESILDSRVRFCGGNCCIWLESHYFFRRRRDASVHSKQGARWRRFTGVVVAVAASFGVGELDPRGRVKRRGGIKRRLSFVLDVRSPTGLLLTLFFHFWQDVWNKYMNIKSISRVFSYSSSWPHKLLYGGRCDSHRWQLPNCSMYAAYAVVVQKSLF